VIVDDEHAAGHALMLALKHARHIGASPDAQHRMVLHALRPCTC
jgi:hypothetical protein